MKSHKSLKELFIRSPIVRTMVWIFIGALVLFISIFFGRNVNRKPVILSVNPPTGVPGDTVTITGENFGSSRVSSSYVEIAGSRITGSGYIDWTNTEIKITLPSNVQDGLVVVATSAGRSEPNFFANRNGIPVAVRPDPKSIQPVIDSLSSESAAVGELITISGSNFGNSRGNSQVIFTASREPTQGQESFSGSTSEFIPAANADYDYQYWSDSEIQVRVPDGAATGVVYVETEKGDSLHQAFKVTHPAGEKSYTNNRTYVVQVSADIQNRDAGENARITLYIPRPPVSALQPSASLNETNPEPLIKDDLYDVIHQISLSSADTRQRFNQSFIVTVFSVTSRINAKQVGSYNTSRLLYQTYTLPDAAVPSALPQVKALAKAVVGKSRNPHDQAKLIYNHMIDSYKLLNSVRTGNVQASELLDRKTGDAYDYAVMYTALCRAAGIPAVLMGGILVENNSTTRNHWWTEIYFEKYGWFPVDVSLGAGLNYKPFAQIQNPREYYFGNLDSQHIAFSRGWKEIKPSLANSKIVYRPRSYALQSIWEEASNSASSYSSLWNDPVIVGIY